jgi:outer membrane receptor for ferrienterochelin and colicin
MVVFSSLARGWARGFLAPRLPHEAQQAARITVTGNGLRTGALVGDQVLSECL